MGKSGGARVVYIWRKQEISGFSYCRLFEEREKKTFPYREDQAERNALPGAGQ